MFEALLNHYNLSYLSVNAFRLIENSVRQLVCVFPNVSSTFTNPFFYSFIHMLTHLKQSVLQ